MMGSGKTTVGRMAAERLGVDFADTDHVVESRAEMSVQEMFSKKGEEVFRSAESGVLSELLDGRIPVIVAAGGGAVLAEENRALLTHKALVVWLRTTVGALAERVGSGVGRPLLAGDPGDGDKSAHLEKIESERRGIYQSLADIVIDTDGRPVESVAEEVVAAVSVRWAATSTATRER
jgi:shikimate kinase